MEAELTTAGDPLASLFADDLFTSGADSGACTELSLNRPPPDVSMFFSDPAVSEPTREDGDFLKNLLGDLDSPPTGVALARPMNVKLEPGLSTGPPKVKAAKIQAQSEATLQRTAKRKVGGTKQESKAVDAEKDSKKQRRLIRNRMSAQLHRERKKAYLDKLEAQLKEHVANHTAEMQC